MSQYYFSHNMFFKAKGHENVLSLHRNTVEFTHESHLTKRGDCILGINADYSLEEIKKQNFEKIKIIIKVDNCKDEITAEYNPEFNDPHEMVIRKTEFKDKRTFAIKADKASKDIKRELVEKMKNPKAILSITIENI